MNLSRLFSVVFFVFVVSTVATQTRAEITSLDDEDLSAVWGQALLELKNTNYNGNDFTRFTLNAELDISANLGGINAGIYGQDSLGLLNGGGVALDIGTLQLGRSDGSEDQRLVTLTNPYLELAYENIDNDSSRKLLGMRMGFEGVDGDIGTAMTTLTGAFLIDLGDGNMLDSLADPLGPLGWIGGDCPGSGSCLPALTELGVLRGGNAVGPSRDFFISVLSRGLNYPSVKGIASPTAMPGLWLNWRDRLSAMVGAMPPNRSK